MKITIELEADQDFINKSNQLAKFLGYEKDSDFIKWLINNHYEQFKKYL